ncbi:hypothetical protein F4861DRAFT_68338 [Xylaria intraflava]|nr:hypothetical protein F4861DRAFT_68338 [Xylaria intraflava]
MASESLSQQTAVAASSKKPVQPWVNPTPRKIGTREARGMPGSARRAREGKTFLCRAISEKQNGQKRKYDDDDGENDGETDVQAKRPKTVEQEDDPSDIAVETILDMVSFPTLKEICAKVLLDETAGTKLKEELLSRTQDVLAHSKAEAVKERDAIIERAGAEIGRVFNRSLNKKTMGQTCDWPNALSPLFPRIEALYSRGSLVRGPELAWETLVQIASSCMHNWGDGEVWVEGDEEDCDNFHEGVDRFMLFICEAQKQDGKISWLQDGRKEDVWRLQEQPDKYDYGKSYTYRYQRTLEFLEKL